MKRFIKITIALFLCLSILVANASAEDYSDEIDNVLNDFNLSNLVDCKSFVIKRSEDNNTTLKNEKDETFIFDNNGDLIYFSRINSMINNSNNPSKALITEESLLESIKNLTTKQYIPNEYIQTSIDKYSDDIWMVNFQKELEFDISNPFDSIKVAFDAVDGSLVFYKRISDFAKTIYPKITETQAIEVVKKYCEDNKLSFSINGKSKLEIINLSIYDDSIKNTYKLVYKISVMDGEAEFWINAETSDIELIDTPESYDAKCFYTYDEDTSDDRYRLTRANNYNSILSLLGYSSSTQYLTRTSGSRTTLLNYINGVNSWAFTFSGHGGENTAIIGDVGGLFYLYPDDIVGVWSFVVLDCCKQGNATWANAFGIYDYNTYGRSFIGWYESIPYTRCLAFSHYFKMAMENNTSSSVLSNVYTAIADIPSNEYYHIRYIGDRTTKGYK